MKHQILNKIVCLMSVMFLTLASMSSMYAQGSRNVSGTVTDETGGPLPGVVVMLRGTSEGTVTDADGRYSFQIPEGGDNVLEFSCLGMETVEMPVGGRAVINVSMEMSSIGLDEAVAIGYGTMIRRDISSAVSSVESDALTKGLHPSMSCRVLQVRSQV